jgi:hypothetical protein
MPVEWAACPICGGIAKGRAGEPLEPDQWGVREIDQEYFDGYEEVIYSDAYMPIEWAESRKAQ